MPIKIQDKNLKDKMMGYMKWKPEMEWMMPMMDEWGPAVETPDMCLEKIKPAYDSRSSDEKLSFISWLLGSSPIEAPAAEME